MLRRALVVKTVEQDVRSDSEDEEVAREAREAGKLD
jgi:hypothetical protein